MELRTWLKDVSSYEHTLLEAGVIIIYSLFAAAQRSVGVSTPWSATDLSPWFLFTWQRAQIFVDFTFSPIVHHPLRFAIRSVLFVLDTNWPRRRSCQQ